MSDPFVTTFARAFVEQLRLDPDKQIRAVTQINRGPDVVRVDIGEYNAFDFVENRRAGRFGIYIVAHDRGVRANPPPPAKYAALAPDGTFYDLADPVGLRRFVVAARAELEATELAQIIAEHHGEHGRQTLIVSLPRLERWLDATEVRGVPGFTLPSVEQHDGTTVLRFCTYTLAWRPDGGTMFRWTVKLTDEDLTTELRTLAEDLRSPFYGG